MSSNWGTSKCFSADSVLAEGDLCLNVVSRRPKMTVCYGTKGSVLQVVFEMLSLFGCHERDVPLHHARQQLGGMTTLSSFILNHPATKCANGHDNKTANLR